LTKINLAQKVNSDYSGVTETKRARGNEMKTAYELLLSAPDTQITRMQLVYDAILAGDWENAAHFLSHAVDEESIYKGANQWARDCEGLLALCNKNGNPYRLVATNDTAQKYWIG
jgi:hypothetical protein